MEHRNITREQAIAMGYIVDRHCYPWVAYRGSRFPMNGLPDNEDMFTIDTPAYTGPESPPWIEMEASRARHPAGRGRGAGR